MNTLFKRDKLFVDTHFVGISAMMWLGLFSEGRDLQMAELLLLVLVCIGSLALLKILEATDTLSLTPRWSSVVMMTAAFSMGTAAYALVAAHHLQYPPANLEEIFFKGIPLAFIIFSIYRFCVVALIKASGKKRIALNITPTQRSLFLEEIAPLKLDDQITFLSRADIEEHDTNGTLSSIDLIVISPQAVTFETDAAVLRAYLAGVPVHDFRDIMARLTGHVCLRDLDLSVYLSGATQKTFARRLLLQLKHLAEPMLALAMVVVLSPLLLLIVALQRWLNPGPIFYQQMRTGYRGRPFMLVKFRTMIPDAERDGPQWASPNDERVTQFGKFLRRTRIDELPQLWNVLRSEMSFVGPRPERPEICNKLAEKIPLFSLRTLARPGITGWAQVCSGYAASPAESLLKLEYDLFYIQHISLRFDLCIVLRTLLIVFVGDQHARRTMEIVGRASQLRA